MGSGTSCMDYHLAINTLIIPYSGKEQKTGTPYEASVAFDFGKEDVIETLEIKSPSGDINQYFRLPLGDNPSPYDSYLVLVSDVST